MTDRLLPAGPIVTAAQLARVLGAPDLVVVDCRYDLADREAGRRAYLAGHVPGARYAHLGDDLSGPGPAAAGRHPLPERPVLAGRFSAWGIDQRSTVVAYDATGGLFAARLWWLLRWLGHRDALVLDSGWPHWRAAGLPVQETVEPARPRTFPVREPLVCTASVDEVSRTAHRYSPGDQQPLTGGLLVDARDRARYLGGKEPIDPVAGHIPGAINFPSRGNLDAEGCWRSPRELATAWCQALGNTPAETAIHYCGSGVTACHNLLALEIAGLPGGRLYAPSWSGWIADPDRPVAIGDRAKEQLRRS